MALVACGSTGEEGDEEVGVDTTAPDWCDSAPDGAAFEVAENRTRLEMVKAFAVDAPEEIEDELVVLVEGYETYSSYDPEDPASVAAVEALNDLESDFNATLVELDDFVVENCGAGAFGL